MKKLWVLLLSACIGLGTLVAQDINTLKQQAQKGDAQAQKNLGNMYANGQGVPQDYVQAVKWYRLAADQGYASAQYNLGVMYDNGQGVPQDYVQAVKWYRLAADQEDADAQAILGSMYKHGQGVPQDDVQAMKWYRLAADQGYKPAQLALGLMYENGRGVRQNDGLEENSIEQDEKSQNKKAQPDAFFWTEEEKTRRDASLFKRDTAVEAPIDAVQHYLSSQSAYRATQKIDEAFEEAYKMKKLEYDLRTAPPHKMFFPRLFKPFPLGVIPWLLALWLLPLPLLFFKKTREMPMKWLLAASMYNKYAYALFALSITYALVGWTGLLASLLTLPFSLIFGPVGFALILCIYKQQWVPVTHLVAGGSFSLLCFWLAMLLFWLVSKIDMWNTDSKFDLATELVKFDKLNKDGLITAEDYELLKKRAIEKAKE